MDAIQGAAGSLVFKRSLEHGKIWVRTECMPGSITVLQDENGADLPCYEAFFYGKQSQERITIEFDQKPAELSDAYLIGFNDSGSDASIRDFLIEHGYAENEIPELFATYELDKVHYLPCAHLPQMPQRMVMILAALRSAKPALVLKDPFMPFSGRWREHFAKLLYQRAQERHQVIVCTNLSFVPQTWNQSNLMQYLDVGHAAEEARAKYRWELERKERELQERQRKSAETTVVAAAAAPEAVTKPTEQNESAAPAEKYTLPEPLQFMYREVQDRIFAPLKEISDFFRAYSALVIVGSMAMLIAVMGIVISPNIAEYREKMKKLGKNVEFSFGSLLGNQPPQKVEPAAPEPIAALNNTDANMVAELPREAPEDFNSQLILPEYEALLPQLESEGIDKEMLFFMLGDSAFKQLNRPLALRPEPAPIQLPQTIEPQPGADAPPPS